MTYQFKVGDLVKVAMVDSRWRWYDEQLPKYLGDELEVVSIDEDGDVYLECDWTFPPSWLELVSPAEQPKQVPAGLSRLEELYKEIGEIIQQLKAQQ